MLYVYIEHVVSQPVVVSENMVLLGYRVNVEGLENENLNSYKGANDAHWEYFLWSR